MVDAALGHGGIKVVHQATGLAEATIRAGIREVEKLTDGSLPPLAAGRIRRQGAGRKPLTSTDPTLLPDLGVVCY